MWETLACDVNFGVTACVSTVTSFHQAAHVVTLPSDVHWVHLVIYLPLVNSGVSFPLLLWVHRRKYIP